MKDQVDERPVFFQNIPFLKKVHLFSLEVGKYIKRGDIFNMAKVIIYYTLLSLFPIIILIGNLLPLLHIDVNQAMSYVHIIFPKPVAGLLLPTIENLLSKSDGGLVSFSIILTIWSGSKGINTLRNSINKVYGLENMNFYTNKTILDFALKRVVSVVITALSGLLLTALSIALIFGQFFIEWLIKTFNIHQRFLSEFLTWKWPIALAVIIIITIAMYYFLPFAKIKLLTVVPGLITTTVGLITLTQFFSLYIRYFGSSWNSYGTIGAFIVFLLWMNMCAVVVMFGATLNAAFSKCYTGSVAVVKKNFKL